MNISAGPTTSRVTPLIVIVGPTASGKSALGVHLAERLRGEVVACDSTQVYRHFDMAPARPTREDQRGIPHHLMDLVEPQELFTAGEYRLRALEILEVLRQRNRLPIVTAGTGLYLRALLEGLADAPTRSEELRTRLNERARSGGPTYLHRSEEHTSELQSPCNLVCRLLLEKKKIIGALVRGLAKTVHHGMAHG